MSCYLLVMAILLVRSVGPSRAYYIAPPFRRSTVRNSVVLLASKDGFEYNDEESYRTRYVGDSDEARELRNMRYEEDMSDTSIVVDNDDYYDEDEEYMDDDDDDDMYMGLRGDDKEVVGNFWSNPKPGFDLLPTDRSATYSRQETSGERPKRRQRPRGARKPKTTFRSGQPKTPEKIADFYDRLFWYGFNPDESIAPGDKTVFGGTKGKFNGLAFFNDDQRKPQQKRKRPPQHFRADEWYDDIMNSIDDNIQRDEDYEYDEEVEISKPERLSPEGLRPVRQRRPPENEYYEERYERRPRKRPSRRPTGRRTEGDWVTSTVSNWFGPEDTYDGRERESDYERDYYLREQRPRRRKKEDSPWSLTSVLDGIFQVNREEVDMNAAMYNRQMGLENKPSRSQRRPDRRRRPGYAYPYVKDDENMAAAEYEKEKDLDVVDVDAVIEDEHEAKESERKRERTIEERAAAFERVPPSGVPAWGPSGEVGVDARTKATLDALEEIREATRKVELKEKECTEAKEDIVVLKADFELQKKRLLANIEDTMRIRSRLRQMQMGIRDAAHSLRRAKAELEVARDRLADLEDGHWALLSMYDADKAFQEVVETFREFEESERLSIRLQDLKELNADGAVPTETVSDAPAKNDHDDNESAK